MSLFLDFTGQLVFGHLIPCALGSVLSNAVYLLTTCSRLIVSKLKLE